MLFTHGGDEETLTQVTVEKKEKATTARAASPGTAVTSRVLAHWLARTQKQTNHRNVQAPVPAPPDEGYLMQTDE